MFSDPLTTILFLGITIILGIIFWIILYKQPILLIIISFIVFALIAFLDTEVISFEIGNFNINILDILSSLLLSTSIIRFIFQPRKVTIEIVLILLLGGLLFSSWLRGTFIYNLESATNSFRTYLYFYSTLLYTTTLKPTEKATRQIILSIEFTAGMIILLAIGRWIMVATGFITMNEWMAPNGSMVRVLTSPATLLILQSMILLNYSIISRKNFIPIIILSVVMTIILAILQQRTVWVALLISTFVVILLKSKFKNLVVLSILFFLIVFMLLLVLNNFSIEDLTGTALDLRNLNWRLLGWESLLSPDRIQSPIDFIFGQPFGTGYQRYILNSVNETTVSPHNFYIQTYLNIGFLGISLLISIYLYTFKGLWNKRESPTNQCLLALLTSQLVFYLTYAPNYEQGIILGMILLYLKNDSATKYLQNVTLKRLLYSKARMNS